MRVIILAAGKGTRMKSDIAKVLTPLYGRPMIAYVLDAVIDAQIDTKPIVVVGHQAEAVKAALVDYSVEFVMQTEQKGTGHAVAVCEPYLNPNESVLVLCGDHPLVSATTIGDLADQHDQSGAVLSLLTYVTPDFDAYGGAFQSFGRIVRDAQGTISAIREYKDANAQEQQIREINPAFYAFSGPWLWQHIKELNQQNAQSEYYLTDLVATAIRDGQKVETIQGQDLCECIGVNTPEQRALVEGLLRG